MAFNRTFNRSMVLLAILGVSIWWTMSLYTAPMMVPEGTITGLHGRANAVDYADIWNTLHPYPRVIYYVGDINCHQNAERTLLINGNEMPVCARDTAIFTAFNFGILVALFIRPSHSISLGILNVFPNKVQAFVRKFRFGPVLFSTLLLALMLAPIAADGGMQIISNYESTNLMRILTGAPAGFAVALYLGVMVNSIGEIDRIHNQYKKDG